MACHRCPTTLGVTPMRLASHTEDTGRRSFFFSLFAVYRSFQGLLDPLVQGCSLHGSFMCFSHTLHAVAAKRTRYRSCDDESMLAAFASEIDRQGQTNHNRSPIAAIRSCLGDLVGNGTLGCNHRLAGKGVST
ncbi:hypothetical protein Pla52o_01340 [Novipirellula galeiformis]|uniref:Uncharacterized protein n=1 Tax=Novipirellula galeiformis TaxID=2528004 RepID=A0A5C6CS80_9BACT|nr:hypothetical protein Pla52o_01340 [Novipirellula galeiformis]